MPGAIERLLKVALRSLRGGEMLLRVRPSRCVLGIPHGVTILLVAVARRVGRQGLREHVELHRVGCAEGAGERGVVA